MIIIDEHANETLMQVLKTPRAIGETYAMEFRLSHNAMPKLREHVIASVQQHLAAHDPDVYFCEDGEVFVVAKDIPTREGMRVMYDVGSALSIHPADDIARIYDLHEHAGRLLLVFERKLETIRLAQAATLKQRIQEQAARKRHEILDQGVQFDAAHIAAQRTARSEPMLMMIEDDAFSQKLVENVLRKQYSITALDTADKALSTYARIAPNLLFLDINLPNVTGHELLEKIIALDPNAYVVMLSGNADKENITQAMSHGAKGFIAKPFTRDKLFQYIERCPTIKKETVS